MLSYTGWLIYIFVNFTRNSGILTLGKHYINYSCPICCVVQLEESLDFS